MTYEEMVLRVRAKYEYADARDIFVHIAAQVNIVGEAEGVFYIEVADREVCVEPYDYHDRDLLITTDAETILAICEGQLTNEEAVKNGRLRIEGNQEKMIMFNRIKFKHRGKKKQ